VRGVRVRCLYGYDCRVTPVVGPSIMAYGNKSMRTLPARTESDSYAVVVDNLSDDGDFAREGAGFEEDNYSCVLGIQHQNVQLATYRVQPRRSA
jgi:hypothetical protein